MTSISEKVLSILKSSEVIESRIKATYKKEYDEVKRHPRVRQEQMPVFVSFLYDEIIKAEQLPSMQEFTDEYMEHYYKNINKNHLIYYAYKQRCEMAYQSLVRDLHFYFKLSESGRFDNVTLSYAYDLEAKQDVVVSLGDLKAGVQLFYGKDEHIKYKKRNASRRRATMGYPDLFLPLLGSETEPVNIGTEEEIFLAYSDKDVKTIYSKLRTLDAAERYPQEEFFIKPLKLRSDKVQPNAESDNAAISHSLIYIGGENIENHKKVIKDQLKKGIRIEWISPLNQTIEDILSDHPDLQKYLRIHIWEKASTYSLKIKDGKFNDSSLEILKSADEQTSFNFGQYITEHASEDRHIMLEAGAGSGKTETMISRIVFLLHTRDYLSLKDVVMITFTNEAADHMRSKLSRRLFDLYKITGNNKYIEWYEEVSSMRIMTIPSFARSVLKDFSSTLGISPDFKISPLTDQKREIIRDVLDEYIQKNKLDFEQLGELREFELEKMIENFWGKMEQKGVSAGEQKRVCWGNMPNDDETGKVLHELLKSTLVKCRNRFEEIKTRYNTLTVQDLTSKIKEISLSLNVDQFNAPFKYLFVDEFQDTDDIQIDLVGELTELNKAHLYVVGDIKQSIYRFRGANYTAFDVLERKLGTNTINRDYKLRKNYRTNKQILIKLEDMFDVWRNDKNEILPEEKGTGRLQPESRTNVYTDFIEFNELKNTWNNNFTRIAKKLYYSMKKPEENEGPVKMAVLVRTNSQAQQAREVLEKMRNEDKNITFEVDTGGALFSSAAARDLLILINSLCYKNDPESLYAVYQTSFSSLDFSPEYIYKNVKSINEQRISEVKQSINGFNNAEYRLRSMPAINVLYSFLRENDFEDNLTLNNLQEHEIKRYRLNIYKILSLATEDNSFDMNSIIEIRNWLKIQVAVNRDEDESKVEITNKDKIIQVLTVHKAKGLEFDTVLVPYTDNKFRNDKYDDILIKKKDGSYSAGWKIVKQKVQTESPFYGELGESEEVEVIREEARLLYVAVTRTENRLFVLYGKGNRENQKSKWSDLIRLWKEGL